MDTIPESNEKVETIRLAEVLGKQVSIDQKMRAFRNKFSNFSDEDKWSKLKRELEGRAIFLSAEELKEDLTMSSDEHNPFDEDMRDISLGECVR